jgi:hypothetical protein
MKPGPESEGGENDRDSDTVMQTKTVQTVKEATVSPFFFTVAVFFWFGDCLVFSRHC